MKTILQALLIIISITGCSSSNDYFRTSPGLYNNKVYVVTEGWHTGIILVNNNNEEGVLPELAELKDKAFIDIGWGEEEYYRIPGFDLRLGLKALLKPNPSAIKAKGFSMRVMEYCKSFDYAIEFDLTDEEYSRLRSFISSTFKKDASGSTTILENRKNIIIFYKANGAYSLMNTCNTWAGSAFKAAGFPVDTSWLIGPRHLFDELKHFGKIINAKD